MTSDVRRGRVTIGWFYPSTLSTYGDRGNVQALVQRARWRGLEARVERIEPLKEIPHDVDVFFIGGGQDSAQASIAESLVDNHGPVLRGRLADGVSLLAICGGYQLLCHEYVTLKSERIPGVGIFDALTRASGVRLVGNVLASSRWGDVVGFENHSGRTYLGAGVEAMGRVRLGQGNNGEDGTEGAISGRAIGSYLHGALLPRNPALTDWLLNEALQRGDQKGTLAALPDDWERATHVPFARKRA